MTHLVLLKKVSIIRLCRTQPCRILKISKHLISKILKYSDKILKSISKYFIQINKVKIITLLNKIALINFSNLIIIIELRHLKKKKRQCTKDLKPPHPQRKIRSKVILNF